MKKNVYKNDSLSRKLRDLAPEEINGLPVIENGRVKVSRRAEMPGAYSDDTFNSGQTKDLFKDVGQTDDKFDRTDANMSDTDETLSRYIETFSQQIIVIGVGGAGNNAISRLQETGLTGALTLAVNTDAQDLFYTNSDQKLLIGKKITNGLGAGNNPSVGEQSAESDVDRIQEIVDRDVVFITCGMGGGTGTGAAPVIAREAQKKGALVVSFCTLPFKMEGPAKRDAAYRGLSKLARYSDTVIPLPNEKLIKLIPKITLMKGFKIMDEILIRSVKGIVDLISNCGLINLDLADVKSVLSKKPDCSGFIGMTEIGPKMITSTGSKNLSKSEINKMLRDRTLKALHNPLLEMKPAEIRSCLVSIKGNQKLSLEQVNQIVGTVSDSIHPRAKLKFGAMINPTLKKIKIHIIGLGEKCPHILYAEQMEADRSRRHNVEFLI